MKQPPSIDSTAELIRSLPTLPKERLLVLWRENFGKPAGSIRAELMIPSLRARTDEDRERDIKIFQDDQRRVTDFLKRNNPPLFNESRLFAFAIEAEPD